MNVLETILAAATLGTPALAVGVQGAKVDVARKSATVDYEPARVTPRQMVDAVNRLAYAASLSGKGASQGAP